VKINGCYNILNVDLIVALVTTLSLVLQQGGVCKGAS